MTTCLWFDTRAEDAAHFYVNVFSGCGRNAKIGKIARYGEAAAKASGQLKNSVMTVTFQLEEQEFMTLNGGPYYKITPAISFIINCKTQKEIDYFWQKFKEDGEEVQCGWINDKFGVSWQIVPNILSEYITNPNRAKADAVMKAMLPMKKLDIETLTRAYEAA